MWGASASEDVPWIGGGGSFDTPGGGGGGGSWGDEEPGFWDRLTNWVNSNADEMTNDKLLGLNWIDNLKSAWHSWQSEADDGMVPPIAGWGSLPNWVSSGFIPPLGGWNEDRGGGRIGASAGMPVPRSSKEGPKGTADDPTHTIDDTVAENTDPDNQPDPGAAAQDSTVTADTPHVGSGAPPGPGGTTPGGITPGSKSITDAAEGLGGVGQSMFSNQLEGTPFSNPLEWPGTKSVGALFTFFGNILGGNTGGGASGLAGLMFPGSGGSGASDWKDQRQIRDSQKRVERLNTDVAEAQNLVDEIAAKPFKFSDEEKEQAEQNLADKRQDAADALEDHTHMLQDFNQAAGGGAVGGLPGIIQNLMQGKPAFGDTAAPGASAMGPAALLPGSSTGFSLAPFGDMITGTPGAAPGDPGLAPFTPGGAGASLPNPSGMVSSASNAQPPQQHGQGGQPGPGLTINQTMTDATFAHGTDQANRAFNTAFRSPALQLGQMPT